MIEKIRKIYLSNILFIISSVLTVFCYIFDAVQNLMYGYIADYTWIFLALILLLQWAYFRGHTNVQKMMFGALLLYMIKEQSELLVLNTELAGGQVYIGDIVILVSSVIIFIGHVYQQTDHKGRSITILINQLLGLVGAIFLLSAVMGIISNPSGITNYLFVIGYFFNCIMVICMETRVDKYKQIRDKARSEGTWTEENRKEAKKIFKLGISKV